MKRFLTVLLCIASLCCTIVVPAYADSGSTDAKVSLLTDLGIIKTYTPEANATRKMMMDFIDILYGENAHKSYFEDKDEQKPVLYGQVLMTLVDITGYSAYFDIYGLNPNSIESYQTIAVRAGIIDKRVSGFREAMSVGDFVELIYNALTDVNLYTYNPGDKSYYVDKNSTLLNTALSLSALDGIVTGTTTIGGNGAKQRIGVNGQWYEFKTDNDTLQYVGMPVRIYFNEETGEIYSLILRDSKVSIITVESDDIITNDTNTSQIAYYADGKRKKTLKISKEADFVYNRCLSQYYTDSDMRLSDCTYRLIDNDLDSKIDVIIADQYESFMADTVLVDDNIIIDTNSRTYNLEDYLEDGYEIYDDTEHITGLDNIGGNNIVSYQKAKDGAYTNFIVTSKRVSGRIESMEEDWKYITVSGTRYKCLESYYNSREKFEEVNVGDEIELFLDFKDRIADIKLVNSTVKAGYVISGYCGAEEQGLRLLQEDGKITVVELANKVTVDGLRMKANELAGCSQLFDSGKAIKQLILYRQSNDGKITMIDTAEDRSGIGSNNHEGFTLDYDSEKASSLRVISLNGTRVLGSKYLPTSDTKVFGIDNSEMDMSYVQSGTAMPTTTSLKIKLYNVGKNYTPQYAVIDATTSSGGWVDVWEKTYVVDKVTTAYDAELGETCYRIEYYDGSGNSLSSIVRDGTLIPPSGNALSGDSSYRQVQIKDVPRGAVVQFNLNNNGISSYAIQALPKADNSEIIFEKSNSVGGNDYGITEYMFNGSSICSYGKVIRRLTNGVIINSHLPTDVEAAKGGVFPMEQWNRAIPLSASDFVWFYDKTENKLEKGRASEILEGDMIFMHRRAGTIMTTIVYR